MTSTAPDAPWTPEELAAVPDAPPPIRWVSVGRIALAVAGGVIAATLVVVPAASWWDSFIKPDTAGLADQVASSMGNSLRSNPAYRDYQVMIDNVTLVRTGENTYTGQATVKPLRSAAHQVSVTVIYDGENMMWETQPGAFAWLVGS